MSLIQRLLTAILPQSWVADMRAHSQSWMVRCACGYERSVWEIGGIRWRAAGNPRWHFLCPQCGKRSWHTVYRKQSPQHPDNR